HADTTAGLERYHKLVARALPIVLVNGYAEGIEAPFVSCDDRQAGELAVAHLVALGHRRIGFISGPERFVPVQRKLAGFRAAMTRLVGGADPELVALSLFGVEGGAAAARRLLDQGATALVCGSDLMALGAIREARAMGRQVPGDV